MLTGPGSRTSYLVMAEETHCGGTVRLGGRRAKLASKTEFCWHKAIALPRASTDVLGVGRAAH